MALVIVRENESVENALRRLKRSVAKDGIMDEVKKREYFVTKPLKRKRKSEEARKKARLFKY
ncbi:MAG: 30S ribosomal protein S21 [Clostridiales Family XIII bacterium]|nr:30S ribosomal protein S21 [Clostridiales Family XIII bacterium]